MRLLLVVLFLPMAIYGHTQDSTLVAVDSVTLTLKEVMDYAKKYHPVIKQAYLQDRFAEAELTGARGTLDPKLESAFNEKKFKGTDYYSKFYNSLKVPLWFPLDPKIEAYRNSGQFLDGEDYVSPTADFWQFTAGVSLPLGKGLFIDERRSMIKQARLYSNIAESEKIKLANKVLYDIVKSYWDWYFAYEQYTLMQQSLDIAEEIFRRVTLDFEFGEAAAVDTIQAKITYQNRIADFTGAKLDLLNARLRLSVHLWDENETPLELTENIIPNDEDDFWVVPTDTAVNTIINWASVNHPEVQKLMAKQQQLEVEEQWNKESLKPELSVSYSFIDAPLYIDGFQTPEFGENYKIGMDFSFPIFLRKERGKLQKTRIYQESTEFEILQTRQEVIADIRSSYAELLTNQQLADQYQDLAVNYNRLLQAEIFNIENGESDLFKLNIQQDKFIESQIKYLKVLVNFKKLKAELPYSTGLPYLSYLKLYE